MNEREIFTNALERSNQLARDAYLDEACAGDADLRQRVTELLQAESSAGEFLETPPPGLALTIHSDGPEVFGQSLGDLSLDFLTPSDVPGCLGTIGNYQVVGFVGRGGCGLVLRAYDTKLNRIVAIKVMAPELATNPTSVKRFLREAQAAAAVRHDHVVTIHAIEESHRPPFIVMEYVEGISLKDRVDQEGELELKEILRIGKQIAQGLVAAHSQGLVHRDIKPANILLENGIKRVKITDFGLARAVDDVGMTQTGMIAGTPQYMSPEQSMGQSIDARSDLFSLGSVLYTLCTGRPAFRADSAVATLRRVCDDAPRSIRSVNPQIPEWFEQIVMRLLAKSPDDRFQTAQEVAELLNHCLVNDTAPSKLLSSAKSLVTPLLSSKPVELGSLREGSWFVPLVMVYLVAIIGSLIFAFVEIESISFCGPVFGFGLGTAIAISAWNARLGWTSIAFGLSGIGIVILVISVINTFGLSPRDTAPVLILIALYVCGGVAWGVHEIIRARTIQRTGYAKPRTLFQPKVFHALVSLQLISIAIVCVFTTLEVESVVVSSFLSGWLLGVTLWVFAFKIGKHVETKIFAISTPVFAVLMAFVISLMDWNTLNHYLPDARWIASCVLVYGSIAIPLGLIGLAKELGLWTTEHPFRFRLSTALIFVAVIAVAFAGAKPCMVFGNLAYSAGVLFVLTLVSLSALLAYWIYRNDDSFHPSRLITIGGVALLVQISFMSLVYTYDLATDYGHVVVRTQYPVKLLGIHLSSRTKVESQMLQDGSTFMRGHSGEVQLAVRSGLGLKVVPSKGVLSRGKPLVVRVLRKDDDSPATTQ